MELDSVYTIVSQLKFKNKIHWGIVIFQGSKISKVRLYYLDSRYYNLSSGNLFQDINW